MLRGFQVDGERDLVFVPLGVNYDRVLEDRSLLSAAENIRVGRVRAAWRTLGFVLHNLHLALRSEWHRFGYACVNFGTPLSMRAYCREQGVDFRRLGGEERKRAVAQLGERLMEAVGRVVPVVPVALMAALFVRQPQRAFSELELKAEAEALLARLQARGAHVYIPRRDLDYALSVGLRMLRLRRLVEERDGLFGAQAAQLPLLAYYANSIAHFG
jgi:glycerol-3-phosphate O-acyltransferase